MDRTTVEEAYRLFLGRLPHPDAASRYTHFDEVITALMGSPEFHASPRSRKNTELGWPENQYFIARNHKLVYCPIGKNACTFLKSTMVRISGHPQSAIILRSVHALTDRLRTGLQLSDYGTETASEALTDPETVRFALLRDPARRLLSAYIEKFVKNRTDFGNRHYHTATVVHAVQARLGLPGAPDFQTGITFRDFVEFVTGQNPARLDPHWRPQHLYLADHRWDRLYMFDDIERLVRDLETMTGLPLKAPPANQSGSGLGRTVKGADRLMPAEIDRLPMIHSGSFLTDDIMERILGYYREDYALIGTVENRETRS